MKILLSQLTNQQDVNEKTAQQIEDKVVERVVEILSPQDIITLNEMLEDENPELEAFLKSKCPDYDKIVENEINKVGQDKP